MKQIIALVKIFCWHICVSSSTVPTPLLYVFIVTIAPLKVIFTVLVHEAEVSHDWPKREEIRVVDWIIVASKRWLSPAQLYSYLWRLRKPYIQNLLLHVKHFDIFNDKLIWWFCQRSYILDPDLLLHFKHFETP